MAGTPAGHGHGHGHAPDGDLDWEELGDNLELAARIQSMWLEQAARWLCELSGGARAVASVVDVGSGPGVFTRLLARTFPDAGVRAFDGTPALLDRLAAEAAREGLADRIETYPAELQPEPARSAGDGADADLETHGADADLVWAANVLHHLGDQQAAVNRLAGLLRPGGTLAVSEGGLPHRYLPRELGFGRSGLEPRLDAVFADWFAAMRAELPGTVPAVTDWPAMLRHAGLTPTGTRSFLVDIPAPLTAEQRDYVHGMFERARDVVGDRLSSGDLATLDRLLDPDDPQGITRRTDTCILTAHTVHTARRPT